tara:strand:+ start:1750 stop:1953 length:204 start_codon:yes stop_codon:yes gene_type:complete
VGFFFDFRWLNSIIEDNIKATNTEKIGIEGKVTAISVSVEAGNGSVAKRILNNQFQVKQWLIKPTRY